MHALLALLPWLLASTPQTNPAAPKTSFRTIASNFQSVYRDLEQASAFQKQVSSSINFSFVCPPTNTTTWKNTIQSDSDAINSNNETVFLQVSNNYGRDKPLAVYLPGLDGYGISAADQYDDLATTFELWRMTVSATDRSSFDQLSSLVADFVQQLSLAQNRSVILIGESFGGLLAPAVALRLQACSERKNVRNPIQGLVMVNPATSFDDTLWAALGPSLASLRFLPKIAALPTAYSVVGGLALSYLIPDFKQLQKIMSFIFDVPINNLNDMTEVLNGMNDGFTTLEERLPGETVQHRVTQWLPVGSSVVNSRLSSLQVPTLVVAGDGDKMLPSKTEADRLVNVMPNCKKLIVKGSGHFILDNRVNLTEAILFSDIDPLKLVEDEKNYDPITDWKLPPSEVIQRTIENGVEPFRRLFSPVFFSTDSHGKRWKGLSKVPSEGPIVFVSNHQLLGFDLGMLVSQLLEERGITARGLAHPILFQSNARSSVPGVRPVDDNNPFDSQTFKTFGAVKVNPRNYYRLMQTGQKVLLFPGGVREVFHAKNEAYQLFWPETTDFVRTAARFNATVIPISAVGSADSLNVLLDAPDIAKLPFGLGDRVLKSSANITAARFNVDNENELFTPPIVAPSKAARHYFMFGKPMSTTNVDHDDKEACEQFYSDVKTELMRGFDDILRVRAHDPYEDPVRRLVYEGITGKKAPTFSMSELNQ